MATHARIAEHERAIIYATLATENAIAEVVAEHEYMSDTNTVYPENRDYWGTLLVDAKVLRRELDRLIELMEPEFPTA